MARVSQGGFDININDKTNRNESHYDYGKRMWEEGIASGAIQDTGKEATLYQMGPGEWYYGTGFNDYKSPSQGGVPYGSFDDSGDIDWDRVNSGSYSGSSESSAERAIREAIEASKSALESQKGTISDDYAKVMADQYVTYRRGQSALPYQVAGRSDGDIASLELQNTANYQNDLSETMRAEAATLANIDQQILDVEAGGQMDLANTIAANNLAAEQRAQELADQQSTRDFEKEMMMLQYDLAGQNELSKLAAQQQYNDSYSYDDFVPVSQRPTTTVNTSSSSSSADAVVKGLRSYGYSDRQIQIWLENGTAASTLARLNAGER